MKEFNKYWTENGNSYLKHECTSGLEYGCAERAWKTALKWVLSWETDQESREIIEKEINGTA